MIAVVLMAAAVHAQAAPGQSNEKSCAKEYPRVDVKVDSVLAADTNEGVDPRLLPMSNQLGVLHYSTYRLVSHQVRATECGRTVAFDLPGGRILHVNPHAIEAGMIEMQLLLFQGERPVMLTDLKLRDHGTLMIGGPRYEQGMLIITVGAHASGIPVRLGPGWEMPDAEGAAAPPPLPPLQ